MYHLDCCTFVTYRTLLLSDGRCKYSQFTLTPTQFFWEWPKKKKSPQIFILHVSMNVCPSWVFSTKIFVTISEIFYVPIFLKVLWCLQIILSKKKKKNTAPSPPRLLLLPSHQLFYSSSAKNIHTFWKNRRWKRDLLKYQRIVSQSRTFKKIFKSSNASEIVLLLLSHQLQYLVHPSNKLSSCLSENIFLEGQTLVRHTHVSQNHLPRLNY